MMTSRIQMTSENLQCKRPWSPFLMLKASHSEGVLLMLILLHSHAQFLFILSAPSCLIRTFQEFYKTPVALQNLTEISHHTHEL